MRLKFQLKSNKFKLNIISLGSRDKPADDLLNRFT
jgi:hypothetical protein